MQNDDGFDPICTLSYDSREPSVASWTVEICAELGTRKSACDTSYAIYG